MGVLEEAVVNAKSAAVSVGKEAGRIVDISKLRLNASEIQKDIARKYEALGKIVYESCKAGQSASVGFDEHIVEIDGLYQKLNAVNEKLNNLRHKTVCPKCGFDNDEQSQFCSRCGARLGAQKAEAPSYASDIENDESDVSI